MPTLVEHFFSIFLLTFAMVTLLQTFSITLVQSCRIWVSYPVVWQPSWISPSPLVSISAICRPSRPFSSSLSLQGRITINTKEWREDLTLSTWAWYFCMLLTVSVISLIQVVSALYYQCHHSLVCLLIQTETHWNLLIASSVWSGYCSTQRYFPTKMSKFENILLLK